MKPDPWGRDRRKILLYGALTIATMVIIFAVVALIDHPWTKCHC